MRRGLLLRTAGAALLLAAGAAWAGPEEEKAEERPWIGILPDRQQAFATKDEPGSERFACRFRDAETGKPVAGVRWVRTPERIAPGFLRHDVVLSVGVSDADGIAHVAADAAVCSDDSHWIGLAAGYAPSYEYGRVPAAEVVLVRGGPFRGRVLDALGRPCAGAVVEAIGGCSHGTAQARARADAEGRFAFERLDRSGTGQLWIEGPGIASDLEAFTSPDSLGTEGVLLETGPATTAVGRVVDLVGEPVEGVVVRAWNEQRGPVTATGADGRFTLGGLERRGYFHVFAPFDGVEDASVWYVDDAHEGVEAVFAIGPNGVVTPDEDAHVVVSAVDAAGAPVGGVSYALAHVETGRGPDGTTRDDAPKDADDPPLGSQAEEVAAGTYRVLPDGPLTAWTFDPVEVRVAKGETARVTLRVRAQPRLRILGAVPGGAELQLRVPGRSEREVAEEGEEWSPPLSAEGAAALRVEVEGRRPFFFPVGPTKDGRRDVTVALPAPRRVEAPAGAREAALWDGRREACGVTVADGAAVETDASGPLTLRWKDAVDRDLEASVVVPAEPGAKVVVDPGAVRVLAKETVVRAVAPPDAPGENPSVAETDSVGSEVVFGGGLWRRLRAAAPREGERVLRWGSATLSLEIVDANGAPVDATVLAADEVYEVPKGFLLLHGFDAGPLRVLVARRGLLAEGRELRLTLSSGVPASPRRVVLP